MPVALDPLEGYLTSSLMSTTCLLEEIKVAAGIPAMLIESSMLRERELNEIFTEMVFAHHSSQ